MEYEIIRPTSEREAIEIVQRAMSVLFGQIEFHRGHRKKAWNGEFVDHQYEQAKAAIEWLEGQPAYIPEPPKRLPDEDQPVF